MAKKKDKNSEKGLDRKQYERELRKFQGLAQEQEVCAGEILN